MKKTPKKADHPHIHGGCNRGKDCRRVECERCFCRECFRALCSTAKFVRKKQKEQIVNCKSLMPSHHYGI